MYTDVLISVIVPVYNAENSLNICIESILKQSYHNLELILVDDGSTDSSGSICDKFASTDKRIKVLHKVNEGVSVARNVGIEAAVGEYISFIDSDDYVQLNYLSELSRCKCDLSICGYITKCGDTVVSETLPGNEKYDGLNSIDYARIYSNNLMYMPWCKLYKRDIIMSNNLRFPVNISLGEDTMFVAEYLKYAKTAYMCNYAGYIYNTVEESFSLSNKTSYETLDMLTISRDFVLSIIDNISPEAALEIRKNTLSNISWYLEKLLLSKMSFQEKKHILNHYLENKYVIETLQDVDKYYNSTRVRRLLSSGNIREIIKSFTKMKRKAKYKQLKHNIRRVLCRK